jgi:arylsulfatase A-like enzyme
MLPQDFADAGWATAAVTNNKIVSIEEGFAQGFASFDQTTFEQDQVFGAQRVTRAALRWLEQTREGPFFLYLHYFDPHDRYQAPSPHTRMHVDPDTDRSIRDSAVRAGKPNAFIPAMNPNARDLTADELQYMRDLYRGEVSYVDAWIGKLFAGLEQQGRTRNTIVVVTSDHGEEFLEHGGLKHAHTLYEELVSVPLILHVPGAEPYGAVVERPVSLVDLPATLRALAGLPARIGDRSWSLGSGEDAPPVLCENWHDGEGARSGLQRSVVVWPRKLIEYADGTAELFDLERDPMESSPLEDAPWGTDLHALLDSIGGGDAAVPDAPVDPDLLEKLKAMGYVH